MPAELFFLWQILLNSSNYYTLLLVVTKGRSWILWERDLGSRFV